MMDNLFDRLKFEKPVNTSVSTVKGVQQTTASKACDVNDDKRTFAKVKQGVSSVDKFRTNQDGGKTGENNQEYEKAQKMESGFVIPKKKSRDAGLFVEIKQNSREYQHDILPAVTKSFRHSQSNQRFHFNRVQSVHNPQLTEAFMERRKALRLEGYSEKEVADSFAYLCVDCEDDAISVCRDGISIGNSDVGCLGHPKMGVQLSKHADILKPNGLQSGYRGYMVVFKVVKGRVKSVAENRSALYLEPTPNFDCHVSNDINFSSTQSLFESTQLYLYQYGDEGVMEIPKNICPCAVLRFTYRSPKDIKVSESVPSVKTSPRLHTTKTVPSSPSSAKEEESFFLWSGQLTVKGLYACNVEMRSVARCTKPARIGKDINITHKMSIAEARQKYLKNLTEIKRKCEGFHNGFYLNICELQPCTSAGKPQFQKVMNYLGKYSCVAVKKLENDVTLLLLTASELTFQLGLTKPHQYPVLLYCLFLSKKSCIRDMKSSASVVQSASNHQPTTSSSQTCSVGSQRDHTKPLNLILPDNPFPCSSSISPSKSPSKVVHRWADSKEPSPQHNISSTWTRPCYGSPENNVNTAYHNPVNMPPPPSPVRAGWPHSPHQSTLHGPGANMWAGPYPNPQTPPTSIVSSCQPHFPLVPPHPHTPIMPPSSPTVHWTKLPPSSTPPPVGMSSPPPYPPHSPVRNMYSPVSPTCSSSQSPSRTGYSPVSNASGLGMSHNSPSKTVDQHHVSAPAASNHWQPWESPKSGVKKRNFEFEEYFYAIPPKSSLLNSDKLRKEFKQQAKTLDLHIALQHQLKKQQQPEPVKKTEKTCNNNNDKEVVPKDQVPVVIQDKNEMQKLLDKKIKEKGFDQKLEAKAMRQMLDKQLEQSYSPKKSENSKKTGTTSTSKFTNTSNKHIADKHIGDKHTTKTNSSCENENLPLKQKHVCDSSEASPAKKSKIEEAIEMKKFLNNVIKTTTLRNECKLFTYDNIGKEKSGSMERGSLSHSPSVSSKSSHKSSKHHSSNSSSRISSAKSNSSQEREGKTNVKQDNIKGNKLDRSEKSSPLPSKLKNTSKVSKGKVAKSWLDVNREKYAKSGVLPALLPSDIRNIGRIPKKGEKSTVAKLGENLQDSENSSSVECCIPSQEASLDASLTAAMAVDKSNSLLSDITTDILYTHEADRGMDSINIDLRDCDSITSLAKRTDLSSISAESSYKDVPKTKFCKDSPTATTDNVQSCVHGSSPHGNSTNTLSNFNINLSSSFLSPTFTGKDVRDLAFTKDLASTAHSSFPVTVPPSCDTLSTNRQSTSEDAYIIPNSQYCNAEFKADDHAGRLHNKSPLIKQNGDITKGPDDKDEKENTKTRSRKTSMNIDEDQPFKKFKSSEQSDLPKQSRGPLKERLKNRRGSSNIRKGSEKETEDLMKAIYSSAVFSVRSRTSSSSSVHGDQGSALDSPKNMLKHALSVNTSSSFQFGKTDIFPKVEDVKADGQDILLLQDDEMDDNVFDEDLSNNDNNNAIGQEKSSGSANNRYSETCDRKKDDPVIDDADEMDVLDKDQHKVHSDKLEYQGRSYYSSVSDEDMGNVVRNPARVVELPGSDMRITIRNNLDSSTINRYQSLDRMVREVLNGVQWPSRQSSSEISLINTVNNVLHKYTLGSADQRQVQGITDDADTPKTLSEVCPMPDESIEMLTRKHDVVNWRPTEALADDIMAEENDIQLNSQKDLETSGSQDQRSSRMVEHEMVNVDSSSQVIDDSNAESRQNIEQVSNDNTDVCEKDKTTEVNHSDSSLATRLRILSELTVPESANARLSQVTDSPKTAQSGPVRTDNKTSRKSRKAHPYQKKKRRRDSWSFDIPYRNLQELMKNLTTATFLERHKGKPKKTERRGESRFRNFRFRRSAIPDFLPESQSESDEFTEDMIPDFEERKKKAELVDTMMGKKEEEQHFTKEQNIYKFVGGENNQETKVVASGLGRGEGDVSGVQIGSVMSDQSSKEKMSKVKVKRKEEAKSPKQEGCMKQDGKTDKAGDNVKVENCNENTTKDTKRARRGTSREKHGHEQSNHNNRKDDRKSSKHKETKIRKNDRKKSDETVSKDKSGDNSSAKKKSVDHKDKVMQKSVNYGESGNNSDENYTKKNNRLPCNNKQREMSRNESVSNKNNADSEIYVKQLCDENVKGHPTSPDHKGYVSSEENTHCESLESFEKFQIPSSTMTSSVCRTSPAGDSTVQSHSSVLFPVEQDKCSIRELIETKDDKNMSEILKARSEGVTDQDTAKRDCEVDISQQKNERKEYEDVPLDQEEMQTDEIDSDWIIVDEFDSIDEKVEKDFTETANRETSDNVVDTSDNVGDKTVTDIVDMNISELEENDQQDEHAFVPVVYLSGVKGHKHQWCKDYKSETADIFYKKKIAGEHETNEDKIADQHETNEDKSVSHDNASSLSIPIANSSSQAVLDMKLTSENVNIVPKMTSMNSDKALDPNANILSKVPSDIKLTSENTNIVPNMTSMNLNEIFDANTNSSSELASDMKPTSENMKVVSYMTSMNSDKALDPNTNSSSKVAVDIKVTSENVNIISSMTSMNSDKILDPIANSSSQVASDMTLNSENAKNVPNMNNMNSGEALGPVADYSSQVPSDMKQTSENTKNVPNMNNMNSGEALNPIADNSSQVASNIELTSEYLNIVPNMNTVNSGEALGTFENRNHVDKSWKPDVMTVGNLQQTHLHEKDAHQEEFQSKDREDCNGTNEEFMRAQEQKSSSYEFKNIASNKLQAVETYDGEIYSKDQLATVKEDHKSEKISLIKVNLKEDDYSKISVNKFSLKEESIKEVEIDKPGEEIMSRHENIHQNEINNSNDKALSNVKSIQQFHEIEETVAGTSAKEEDLSSKEAFNKKIENESAHLEESNSVLEQVSAVICNSPEHFDLTKTFVEKDLAEQNVGIVADHSVNVLETVDINNKLEDKATVTMYAETQSPMDDDVVEEAFCIEILNTDDVNEKEDEVQSLESDNHLTEVILKHLENSNTNEDLSGMYFIFDEDKDINLGAELEIDDMINLTKGDGTEFCDQADSEFVEEHNIDPTLILHDTSLSHCVIQGDKELHLQDAFRSCDADEQNREEDMDISIRIDDEEYSEWQESEQETKRDVQNAEILGAVAIENYSHPKQEKKPCSKNFIDDYRTMATGHCSASSFENNQASCSKEKTSVWNRLQNSSGEKETEVDSGESVVADSQEESEIDDCGILSLSQLAEPHTFLKDQAFTSITDDSKSIGKQYSDESPNRDSESSGIQSMEMTSQGEKLSHNSEIKKNEITEVSYHEAPFHHEVISSDDCMDGIKAAVDGPLHLNFTTPVNQTFAGFQKQNQISVKGSTRPSSSSDSCKDRPLSQNVQEVTPLVHSGSAAVEDSQNKNLPEEQEQPKIGHFLPAQNLYLGNGLLPAPLPFVYHQQSRQPNSSFIMYDERQPYLAYLPYAPPVQRTFPFPVISTQVQLTPSVQALQSTPDLSRGISLQQHGIMSCLDPNLQHFTNSLRQQLQSRIFSTVGTIGSTPSLTGNIVLPQVNGPLSQRFLNLSQPCVDASYKDLYLRHRLNYLMGQQGNALSDEVQSPYLGMDNAVYCHSRAADNPLNYSNLLQSGMNHLPISNPGVQIREAVPEVTLPPISTFTQRPLTGSHSEPNSSAQDDVSATVPLDLACPKVQELPSLTHNTGRPPVGRVNPIPKDSSSN